VSAFVQGNIASSSAASFTITLPSAPGNGHILTIAIGGQITVSGITDSQGNVWTVVAGYPGSSKIAWQTMSNGTTGAYTATLTNGSPGSSNTATLTETSLTAGFTLQSTTWHTFFSSGFGGTETFTAPAAGATAILISALGNTFGSTAFVGGTGVVQRETDSYFISIGDKLSASSGSNVWTVCQDLGCSCGGTLYTLAIVYSMSSAPLTKSVLFDAMNE